MFGQLIFEDSSNVGSIFFFFNRVTVDGERVKKMINVKFIFLKLISYSASQNICPLFGSNRFTEGTDVLGRTVLHNI